MFDWEQIKEQMRSGVVLVTFKKVDGSLRTMECTLAEYLLPPTAGAGKAHNEDVVIVFDIEKESWRSFRKDSVISVEVPE